MNRRILSALTGAILLGGLAIQLAPQRVLAARADCATPYVASIQNAVDQPGHTVTVSGSGFTCGGQANSTSLSVGGAGVQPVNVSDGSLQFSAPSSAAGSVVVTINFTPTCLLCGPKNVGSNADHLFLLAPNAGGGTATPGPGGGFTVSGSGFTMGGYMRSITASACGQGLPVGSISDTSVALTAPGGYCNGAVSLGITGYANSSKNPTLLTNTFSLGAGSLNISPSTGGLSTGAAAPGQVVSFSGAGFGTSGSATLNGAGIGSNWSDNSISFTVRPDSTSGAVRFVRGDGYAIGAGNLTVNSQIAGVSASRAQAGDTVTINGAGFGPGGAVALGGGPLGIKSWSPTSIAVTIPAGAAGGDLTVTPQGNAPSTLPNGLAIMHIAALKPANGAPGATIGITGSGFGGQKGSVSIAGANAPVTIWGDSTIAVVVPSTASGDKSVSVNVPGAASPLTAAFHVDPVPPATPGSTPGQTPGNTPGNTPGGVPTIDPLTGLPTAGSTASPTNAPSFIPPSDNGPVIQIGPVPFHKAPKVAGPVDLALASTEATADPGVNVPFTVTLTAFGQPVVGAPVDLLLVVVPGGDASISPAKGVTDASGKVSGVLHLSKRAGDHIILARSGQYSDEIKVTGRGATTAPGTGSGTDSSLGGISGGSPQRTIIVAALLACLVLFLSGFGINLATARNSAGGATATRRRSVAGNLVALPVGAGAAAQFGLAMMVCSFGQIVAVLRRR
jgi:hypothetical protein